MAIVDVMGHVGRVVAELNGDVLAAGVLQLAVLPLAGTNNAQKVPRCGAAANMLLSTKSQLNLFSCSCALGSSTACWGEQFW